jgi:Cofactor assembly of complex C subunit B, CCB2/CCB4
MRATLIVTCVFLVHQSDFTHGFQMTSTHSNEVNNRISKSQSSSLSMSTESDMEGKRGMKGYYRRPSRAIEKGGGFFVPGLEGEKIRVVSAAAIILMIASNRAGVQDATVSQITSEVIGIVMALILFLQGIAEAFPQIGSSTTATSSTTPVSNYLSVIQSASRSKQVMSVEAAARSIVQTCEDVSYVLVVSNVDGKVIFELGPVSGNAATAESCGILSGFSGRNAAVSDDGIKSLSMFQPSSSFLARISNSVHLPLPEKVQSVAVLVDGKNEWTWLIAAGSELSEFSKSQQWIDSLVSAPF